MTEEINPIEFGTKKNPVSRPFLLSALCLFAMVNFGFLSILFLLATFYSGRITHVLNIYIPEDHYTPSRILLLFLAGSVLNALAFSGTVLIWKLRRTGYYIMAFSCVALATFYLKQPNAAISTTAVYILLVILFGVYYRRLR